MSNAKTTAALQAQIQKELYSSYLYLSMAGWAEAQNLKGFANWLMIQHEEEQEHGMKIFEFLIDIGVQPKLEALPTPPSDFGSPLNLFKEVLGHEQKITKSIHDCYAVAVEDKDYRAQIMLQWFITEQIEEEVNASEILAKLEAIGEKSNALYWIDKELKKRGKES